MMIIIRHQSLKINVLNCIEPCNVSMCWLNARVLVCVCVWVPATMTTHLSLRWAFWFSHKIKENNSFLHSQLDMTIKSKPSLMWDCFFFVRAVISHTTLHVGYVIRPCSAVDDNTRDSVKSQVKLADCMIIMRQVKWNGLVPLLLATYRRRDDVLHKERKHGYERTATCAHTHTHAAGHARTITQQIF